MIIAGTKSLNNKDLNIYEALLEFNDIYYNFRERMQKYNHYKSIMDESSDILILEENKLTSTFKKIIEGIKNLLRKFLDWIDSIKIFFNNLMHSNKNLQANKKFIALALNDFRITDDLKKKVKLKKLKTDDQIKKDCDALIGRTNEVLRISNDMLTFLDSGGVGQTTVYGYNYESNKKDKKYDLKEAKKKADNIALEKSDDNNSYEISLEYIKKQSTDILNYVDNKSPLDKTVMSDLYETKSNLNQIEKRINKYKIVYDTATKISKTYKEDKDVNILKNSLTFLSDNLRLSLMVCIGCINGIKEKKSQLKQLAIILMRMGSKIAGVNYGDQEPQDTYYREKNPGDYKYKFTPALNA